MSHTEVTYPYPYISVSAHMPTEGCRIESSSPVSSEELVKEVSPESPGLDQSIMELHCSTECFVGLLWPVGRGLQVTQPLCIPHIHVHVGYTIIGEVYYVMKGRLLKKRLWKVQHTTKWGSSGLTCHSGLGRFPWGPWTQRSSPWWNTWGW